MREELSRNRIIQKFATWFVVMLCFGFAFAPVLSQLSAASPPNIVSYQGRVLDSNGVPVASASLNFKFWLYTASAGGTCLWSNSSSDCDSDTPASTTARSVTLTDGLFSENLGDTGHATPYAAIPDTVFDDNGTVYLELEIAGETLSPRKMITAAPYALNADSLDGLDSTELLSASGDTATGEYDFTGAEFLGASPLVFEGATNDGTNLTSFAITDPTGANTITFQDGSGTVAFTSDISTSLWTDGGTYLYPAAGEVLGNSSSAGSNKMAGLYLGDSSPLVIGADNDVTFSFSGSVLSGTLGSNDLNLDSNTFFVDGSADSVGIGTATPGAALEVEVADTANLIGLIVDQDDVTNDPVALAIQNAGTGDSLTIDHNGAATTSQSLYIDQDWTGGTTAAHSNVVMEFNYSGGTHTGTHLLTGLDVQLDSADDPTRQGGMQASYFKATLSSVNANYLPNVYGVYSEVEADGSGGSPYATIQNAYAFYGDIIETSNGSVTNGYGGYFRSDVAGTNYGIFGYAGGSGNNFGADLNVDGGSTNYGIDIAAINGTDNYGINMAIGSGGSGDAYGIDATVSGATGATGIDLVVSGSGVNRSLSLSTSSNSANDATGVYNTVVGSSSGNVYGSQNYASANGSGIAAAVAGYIQDGTSVGNKYALYGYVNGTISGTPYGLYILHNQTSGSAALFDQNANTTAVRIDSEATGSPLFSLEPINSNTRGTIAFGTATSADPTGPSEGDLWYESTDNELCFYDGSANVCVDAVAVSGGSLWEAGTYGTYEDDDDVIVGSEPGDTTPLTNTSFVLGGDDLYVADDLGALGDIYVENSFIAGSGTLTLSDSGIVDSDSDLAFTSTTDGFSFTFTDAGAGDDFAVDGTVLVVESDNDRVGIGTNAPTSTFHVSSGEDSVMTVSANSVGSTGAGTGLSVSANDLSDASAFAIYAAHLDGSPNMTGNLLRLNQADVDEGNTGTVLSIIGEGSGANIGSNLDSASTGTVSPRYNGYFYTTNNNTMTGTLDLSGVYSEMSYSGDNNTNGTTVRLRGGWFTTDVESGADLDGTSSRQEAHGVSGHVSMKDSQTIGNIYGASGRATANNGTTEDAFGLHGEVYTYNAAATIDVGYGVYGFVHENSTGTVTTAYGGYFTTQDAGTNYGIYASAADYAGVFTGGGNVGIGDTTPSHDLVVSSNSAGESLLYLDAGASVNQNVLHLENAGTGIGLRVSNSNASGSYGLYITQASNTNAILLQSDATSQAAIDISSELTSGGAINIANAPAASSTAAGLLVNFSGDTDNDGQPIYITPEPNSPVGQIHLGTGQNTASSAAESDIWYDDDNGSFCFNDGSTDVCIDADVNSVVDGTGVANRVAYWSDTDTITQSANLTYDATDLALTLPATGSFALDAATTDSTEAGGILDLTADSSTDDNYALAIDYELTDDNSANSNGQGGITINLTQSSNDGDDLIGLNIANLSGTASSGFELGAVIGTGYDFGMMSNSAVYVTGTADMGLIGDSTRTATMVVNGGTSTHPGDNEIVVGSRVINQSSMDPTTGHSVDIFGVEALSQYTGSDTDATIDVAGIYAHGASSSGTGTINVFGVDALAQELGGTVANAYGIRATANTAATVNYGVYAAVSGGGTNYSGIFTGGNFGIGDTTPEHTLDVDGNIGMTAGGYLNFGDTTGSSGYGFRDSGGVLNFKNSGGSWAAFDTLEQNFDEVYNTSVADGNFVADVDNASGLSFDITSTGHFMVDLQSTGDFQIQDVDTAFFTFNDTGDLAFDYIQNASAAPGFDINANSIIGPEAVLDISSTSSALLTGELALMDHTATYTSAGAEDITANLMSLSRTVTENKPSDSLTVSGSILSVTSTNSATAGGGTFTETGNVVSFTQAGTKSGDSASNYGGVLFIDNDGRGDSITIDQDMSGGGTTQGIDLDFNMSGDSGADTDTMSALMITVTNNTIDQADPNDDDYYGLHVANLAGIAKSGDEYAIYQAGTSWDYGLYIEDQAYFGDSIGVNTAATSTADLTISGSVDRIIDIDQTHTTDDSTVYGIEMDITHSGTQDTSAMDLTAQDVALTFSGDSNITDNVQMKGVNVVLDTTTTDTTTYMESIALRGISQKSGSGTMSSLGTFGDLYGVAGAAWLQAGTVNGELVGTYSEALIEGASATLGGSGNGMMGSYNTSRITDDRTAHAAYGSVNTVNWSSTADSATSDIYANWSYITHSSGADLDEMYGIYASASETGAATVGDAFGGYFAASGATNNYSMYGGAGLVQIEGDATATSPTFSAVTGSGDVFIRNDVEIYNGALCIGGATTCASASGSTAGNAYADGSFNSTDFDLAERIPSNDATLVPGEVVVVDTTDTEKIARSSGLTYDDDIIGVISTAPAFVMGWGDDPAVALSGRVPVRVSAENGSIAIGDPLTTSSIPGYAMKATEAGMIIGRAMQAFSGPGTDVVVAFIDVDYYTGAVLATDGTDSLFGDRLVMNSLGNATVGNPVYDSNELVMRGTAWDGAFSQNQDLKLKNVVTSDGDFRLSILNTTDAEVAYVTNQGTMFVAGDLIVGDHLYPSDRGTAQTDKYIYYDGSVGPGGDFMRTNASGWATGSYDFAEMFPSYDELEPGDVVVFAGDNEYVRRSDSAYDYQAAGIISTKPGFLAGDNQAGHYPVALAGRVPVKVSLENGPIAIGDPLTTSSTSGQAMKATEPGTIIGNALEPFDGSGDGTIIAFVNVSYYGGGAVSETPGVVNTASGFGSNVNSLTLGGNLYLQSNNIIGVANIEGIIGNWSISEAGDFKTKGRLMSVIESYQGEEVEAEAVLALESTVTISGTGQLTSGTATIQFEDINPDFNDVISTIAPVRVMAIPVGEPVTLFVTEQNNNGFTISTDSGSDAEFNWFATAYRKDHEPAEYLEAEFGEEPVEEEVVEDPATEEPTEEVPVEETSAEEPVVEEDPVVEEEPADSGETTESPDQSGGTDEPTQETPASGDEPSVTDTLSDPPADETVI